MSNKILIELGAPRESSGLVTFSVTASATLRASTFRRHAELFRKTRTAARRAAASMEDACLERKSQRLPPISRYSRGVSSPHREHQNAIYLPFENFTLSATH